MAIIAAFKNGETKVYTKSAHQFDRGQKLIMTGIALPDSYEIHFSNDPENGIASAFTGDPEGVLIPDAYFISGDYVYAWLYVKNREIISYGESEASYEVDENETLHVNPGADGEAYEEGYTMYSIVIPVVRRPSQLTMNVTSEREKTSGTGFIGYRVDENGTLIPVIK